MEFEDQPMRDCSVCKKPQTAEMVAPKGVWETKILTRLGLQPYECRSCHARFFRFGNGKTAPADSASGAAPKSSGKHGKAQSFPVFLPPEDGREFDEVVEKIRLGEKKARQDARLEEPAGAPLDVEPSPEVQPAAGKPALHLVGSRPAEESPSAGQSGQEDASGAEGEASAGREPGAEQKPLADAAVQEASGPEDIPAASAISEEEAGPAESEPAAPDGGPGEQSATAPSPTDSASAVVSEGGAADAPSDSPQPAAATPASTADASAAEPAATDEEIDRLLSTSRQLVSRYERARLLLMESSAEESGSENKSPEPAAKAATKQAPAEKGKASKLGGKKPPKIVTFSDKASPHEVDRIAQGKAATGTGTPPESGSDNADHAPKGRDGHYDW